MKEHLHFYLMLTMVHTVLVEEKAESVLKALLNSGEIQVGLLIGQVQIFISVQPKGALHD